MLVTHTHHAAIVDSFLHPRPRGALWAVAGDCVRLVLRSSGCDAAATRPHVHTVQGATAGKTNEKAHGKVGRAGIPIRDRLSQFTERGVAHILEGRGLVEPSWSSEFLAVASVPRRRGTRRSGTRSRQDTVSLPRARDTGGSKAPQSGASTGETGGTTCHQLQEGGAKPEHRQLQNLGKVAATLRIVACDGQRSAQ